jgi:hypothetical protein
MIAQGGRILFLRNHHFEDDSLASRAPVGSYGAVLSSLAIEEAPVSSRKIGSQKLGIVTTLCGADFKRDFTIVAHVQQPFSCLAMDITDEFSAMMRVFGNGADRSSRLKRAVRSR